MATKNHHRVREQMRRLARRALRNDHEVHVFFDESSILLFADGGVPERQVRLRYVGEPEAMTPSATLGDRPTTLAVVEKMTGTPAPPLAHVDRTVMERATNLLHRAIGNGWGAVSIARSARRPGLIFTASPFPGSGETIEVVWDESGALRARVSATDGIADTMAGMSLTEVRRVLGAAPHPSLREVA